jgi:hypothetical protein
LLPARRPVSGACPDIRPSNRLCATRISSVSVFPASTFLPTLNLIEPPWYGPVCPVVWDTTRSSWRRSRRLAHDRGDAGGGRERPLRARPLFGLEQDRQERTVASGRRASTAIPPRPRQGRRMVQSTPTGGGALADKGGRGAFAGRGLTPHTVQRQVSPLERVSQSQGMAVSDDVAVQAHPRMFIGHILDKCFEERRLLSYKDLI